MWCRFEGISHRTAQSRHCLCALLKANLGDYCMTCLTLSVSVDAAFSPVCTAELHEHAQLQCAYNTLSHTEQRFTKFI